MKKTQFRLFRDLLILALTVTGLIVLLVIYAGNTSRREYSETIIAQATVKFTNNFANKLQPFNTGLDILQKWGSSEQASPALDKTLNTELLNDRFIPLLESLGPQIYFHLASSRGRSYLLYRKDQNWLTRTVDIDKWSSRQKWQSWKSSGELDKEWWSEGVYDPRTEPWYQQTLAADSQQPVWLEPYIQTLQQQPTLSGAIQWQRQNGQETLYVASFDIPQEEIYQMVSALETTDNGFSFIARDDGRVFTPLLADKNQPDKIQLEQIFLPPSQLGNPVIAEAVTVWQKQPDSPSKPFYFSVNGQGWWAGFKALGHKTQALFWTGIAIPENDFLSDVSKRRYLLYSVFALLVVSGVLLMLMIVRRHGKDLQQFQQTIYDADQIAAQLPVLLEQGENYKQEFKSTMRHNLRDDKQDKGIELAWLKCVVAFLNSEGGTLFIGTADDGTILGLDADNFANEDKCRLHFKNLLSQHIGVEYSKYIHLDIVTHAEKQLAVVQCEKSPGPVFLKVKNDEEFYIRSGPSSTKLTGSKLLKYLEQRKTEKS